MWHYQIRSGCLYDNVLYRMLLQEAEEYSMDTVRIILEESPTGPALNSPEYRNEVTAFMRQLREAGVEPSSTSIATFDSLGVAGYITGFTLALAQILAPEVKGILEAWFSRHKCSVEIGGNKISANRPEDAAHLIEAIERGGTKRLAKNTDE